MSLQNEIIKRVMMYRRKEYEKQEFDVLGIRHTMDELFKITFLTPWTVSVNEIVLDGIDAEIISPRELNRENAIILYVHGGGYFMGSIETHRPLAGWVVHETGIPAVIFNYRLAPEHPFPAGRDDVIKVYSRLLEEYPNKRIAMVGDSAGAGLITQVLLGLKELEVRMPACACLMSPFLDLTCEGDSLEENEDKDPFVIPRFLRAIIPMYVKEPYSPKHELTNPLYGDLSDFPPLLTHVGSIEVLADDARNFHKRAMEYDVDTTIMEYDGLPHVWQFNRQFFMPESQKALGEMRDFIFEHIPETETAAL